MGVEQDMKEPDLVGPREHSARVHLTPGKRNREKSWEKKKNENEKKKNLEIKKVDKCCIKVFHVMEREKKYIYEVVD